MKLPAGFYLRHDVIGVSRELLGKVLCTRVGRTLTRMIITETEAYAGVGDRASHAYGGRRTARTEPMFARGGIAYVYLCYGMHHLFNVVTGDAEVPHAVLIRAGRPFEGTATMLKRRHKSRVDRSLLAGPGCVSQALGIETAQTGTSLLGDRIWIEDRGIAVDDAAILVGPRVGVDYAGPDAARPWRFRVGPQQAAE